MKRLIFAGIVTTLLAASSLTACGGGSCLNEFPCNVEVPDGSYDGGPTHVTIDAGSDASDAAEIEDANVADAIDDMSTIDAAQFDGGDAADD